MRWRATAQSMWKKSVACMVAACECRTLRQFMSVRRFGPGCDQPVGPQPGWQEPDQGGEDRAVGPVQPGPRTGTAVRAENRIHASDQQSCSLGALPVMITGHVPAVRVPPDYAASRGLRLSRREEMWKTAEILILRHQLAVLQRWQLRRPKLNWADRALLAALLGVIPKARRHGLRLLVTPDTIVRWHRGIIRRRWAAR